MASPTLKELKYRTFDDLMNEVFIDLPSFTREGMVETGQLVKIAQKCNYELGIKIHNTKQTMLEVEHGRAKLPSDFYMLNLALLCSRYRICEPTPYSGLHTEDVAVPLPPGQQPYITTCPCWTIISYGARRTVTYCDGTSAVVYFPSNDDGTPKTTNICALDVEEPSDPDGKLTATKGNYCYNYPDSGYSCTAPDPCCSPVVKDEPCNVVNPDPWHQNKVYTTCNGTMQVNVIEYRSNEIREYSEFATVYMKPSKEASAFCVNTHFRDAIHNGYIRDGFIWVPTMRDDCNSGHGRMYICYLGAMEDEQGNLLILDHPKINEYYEWAIKERVLQNLYLNGEPDLKERWMVAKSELKTARIEALSIVATPDFYELKNTIEMNRRAMYHKYVHPFSSLYANSPGYPWGLNKEFV